MVLVGVLAVTALAAVVFAVHIEQRSAPAPATEPEWARRVRTAAAPADLLDVPLPKVRRGYDPVAVRALVARAVALHTAADDASGSEGSPGSDGASAAGPGADGGTRATGEREETDGG